MYSHNCFVNNTSGFSFYRYFELKKKKKHRTTDFAPVVFLESLSPSILLYGGRKQVRLRIPWLVMGRTWTSFTVLIF